MEIIDQILAVQSELVKARQTLANGDPGQAEKMARIARINLKAIKPVGKLDQLEWGQVKTQADLLIDRAQAAAQQAAA